MDDYAALVERVCFVLPKVFGCLLLSEDGMILSEFPEEGGEITHTAWQHFCSLDEPARGFLAFGDQHWAYVRHGAYAVFVVADVTVRPGVMIDRLEQVLSTAAISRAAGTFKLPEATAPAPEAAPAPAPAPAPEPVRAPAPAPDPVPEPVVSAPRPEPEPKKDKKDKKDQKKGEVESPIADPVLDPVPTPVAASVAAEIAGSAPAPEPEPDTVPAGAARPAATPAPADADAGASWAKSPSSDVLEDDDDEEEVDRFQLAQEFSGLLQMDRSYDEG